MSNFNPFIVSPSRDEKSQFWANYDILRVPVVLYPAPFTDEGQICCAKAETYTIYAYTPNLGLISLFCRPRMAKISIFSRFFCTSAFVMWPVGGDLRKLNTGAQLETFPYPTVSKIQNHFCIPTPSWRNRSHKL